MNLDWLRAVSAKIGIEGRNIIIVSGLVFCGFGLYLFTSGYSSHPLLSWVFSFALFFLGSAIVLIGLLAKPQPSEIAQKFLLQQIGQQIFYAGGFQSPSALADLLREAHNIKDLPPPCAVVRGSASNEADHREISAGEAEKLVRKDRENIREMFRLEAEKIISSLGVRQVASGQQRRIGASSQPNSDSTGKKQA